MGRIALQTESKSRLDERRSGSPRTTTVFRVGLLSDGLKASYCLLRNISSTGVQIRTFVPIIGRGPVHFRVGDSERERCRVAWKRNYLIGLEFEKQIDPQLLLRPSEYQAKARRSSPRISAAALATVRTGGRTFSAELRDISPTGAKIRTRKPLAPRSPVLITIPDLPVQRGFVCWTDGELSGLMFESPLPIPLLAVWLSERRRVSHES